MAADRSSEPVPTKLGKTLERLVKNLGAPPISILSQMEERWPDLVGPGLSASTRPIELVGGVLTVGCDDATFAAQIGWMEGQIKQRFTSVFGIADGRDLVQRVVTRVDR